MIKIYWAPRTRSFTTLWMMEETGQPYERVLIDIRQGDQKRPGFAEINPLRKVPALEDGDVHVAESAAICTYLADKFPGAGLAPRLDDRLRGRYLQWMFFAAGNMEPAFFQAAMNLEVPEAQAGWGSFDRCMGVIEGAVSQDNWLLGERFSAADVLVATSLYYGMKIMGVVPERPAFLAYISRAAARPAFQRAQMIDNGAIDNGAA